MEEKNSPRPSPTKLEREKGGPLNPPKGDLANTHTLAFSMTLFNLYHSFDGGFSFLKIDNEVILA
jgi:hypothetical protein